MSLKEAFLSALARFDRRYRSQLRLQLLSGFGQILLGMLVLSCLVIGFMVYQMENNAWRERQADMAVHAAHEVNAFLERQLGTLQLLDSLGRDEMEEQPQVLNAILADDPALLEVVYLDRAGQVVAHASQEAPVLAHVFTIPQSRWFQVAQAGETCYSGLQIAQEGDPYLIVALPGAAGGVIAARLDMVFLWQVVEEVRFGESGRAYVVDGQGYVIAHPDLDLVRQRASLAGLPGLQALQATPGQAFYPETRGLDGKTVIGAKAPVKGTGWQVITEMSVGEFYRASRLIWILLLSGGALIYLLVTRLVSRLLDRRVLQPLARLQAGARQVGQGNLDYRVNLARLDELGQVAAAFDGMAADLGARQRQLAEGTEALRSSEERLKTILDSIQSGILVIDPETHLIIDANPAALRMVGSERGQIIGSVCHSLVCPAEQGQCPITDKGQTVDHSERVLLRKDGERLPILKTVVPIRLNNHPYLVESFVDLSNQKRAEALLCERGEALRELNEQLEARVEERTALLSQANADLRREIAEREQAGALLIERSEALRASEAKFRELFENVMDGVFRSSPEGKILTANPALVRLLGFTSLEELQAVDIARDLYVDPREREQLAARLRAEGSYQSVELQLKRRDGPAITVLESVHAVYGAGGEVLYFEGTLTDITERKQAEALLEAWSGELQRKNYQQERLIDAARQLTASLDVHAVLRKISEGVMQILDAFGCVIYLLNDDGLTLRPVVAIDPMYELEILNAEFSVATSLNGRAIQAGRGMIINRPLDDDHTDQIPGTPVDRMERVIIAPLLVDGRALGSLCLNRMDADFTEQELLLAETFAAYASAALKNAQAHADLQREVEERTRMEAALRESEAQYRDLFDNATDLIQSIAPDGRFLFVNRAWKETLGYSDEELDQLTIWDILDPACVEHCRVMFARLLAGETVSNTEVTFVAKDGRTVLLEGNTNSSFQGGQPVSTRGIFRDITQRRRAEEALRESQERYTLAIQGANDGLWDWDLRAQRIYFSPRWKAMLGCAEGEVGDSPDEWFNRIHPDDLETVKVGLARHLQGLTPHFESEHRMRQRDGEDRWVLARGLAVRALTPSANGPVLTATRMAGSLSDITARKEAERQLLHDAFHDALTGLPNRALFMDRLGRALERTHRRPENPFAVLFLDLDRFKVINDSLGHTVGDELLVGIARRLSFCLRSADTAARLGGDEFVVLLEDIQGVSDADQVAERIRAELKLPFVLEGHEVVISTSIGIVYGTGSLDGPAYERTEEVLRDADIALYKAKELGKDRSVVFTPALRTLAIDRLELENELRAALERGEFQLHYQPIHSLANERLIGFEALLRWNSPARGYVPPGKFIQVAEETGLIVPVGEWVLRTACRQLRQWQAQFPAEPPLTVNVNISGVQFAHPDLLAQVQAALVETGLDAACLRLEITESVFMQQAEETADKVLRALEDLRQLGVQLHIDDFGTGYSSLAYLQRFPVSTIKIDRSFVERIGVGADASANGGGNGNGSEIIRTIVALARDLGMQAVAEGVETQEQLDQLKALECPFGQGYFIARPMSPDAVETLLAGTYAGRCPAAASRPLVSPAAAGS